MGYLDGFLVTVRQIGRKQRVTTQYPQEKAPIPERRHGRHGG